MTIYVLSCVALALTQQQKNDKKKEMIRRRIR